MVDYLYTSKPVIDPVTGNLVADASLQFYAEDDLGHTTPLPVTDVTGLPLAAITTNRLGLHAPFIVADEPVGVLSDGTYSVAVDSPRGMLTATEAAQAATEAAYAELQAYILANPGGGSPGVTAHGALSGLGAPADDHPQYHTDARGDVRYYTKEAASALIAAANAASSVEDRKRGNHTGTQPISSVTDLESRLAALEAAGSGSGITLIPEGTEPPAGSPVGIYGFIPGGEVPTTNLEVVSYTSTGSTVTCPVPTAAAVGDVLVFIPAFVGSDTNITVSDTGWVEKIDYAGQQTRKSGMYIYQVADATALAALGSTVTASVANPGVRGGAVVRLTGALSGTAWPTYSSGSNRSAATLNSATTTGFTVQSFATATVPFDRVMMWSIHDADNVPAASSGFTVLGHVSSSNAGATPITLTLFIKTHSTTPVPAAPVTFPTAASAVAGGGQFIVPAV